MGIGSFFYLPKPKGFNYIPRYFDPEKEEREERRRKLHAGKDNETDGTTSETRIRGKMRSAYHFRHEKRSHTSTIRVIIFLVLLFLLIYWLYF